MTTVDEVMSVWKKEGYTADFNRDPGKQLLASNPQDFRVDKIYRYEGMSDPEDQEVLFAISSEKLHKKGLLLNAFGVYSDSATNEIMEKVKYHNA